MKKSIFTLSAIALVAFGISSCQKEETASLLPQHFRACAENSAKTTLNDQRYTQWDAGDQVFVGSPTNDLYIRYSATPDPNDPTWADFYFLQCFMSNDANYNDISDFRFLYAIYPYEISQYSHVEQGNQSHADQVVLPEVQNSLDGRLTKAPMVSDWRSIDFSANVPRVKFQNLCGVMKIHLQQENTSISEIAVIADQQLRGTYTISYTDGTPALTPVAESDANYVTLALNGAQDIRGEGKDFYIYLPAGNYTNMQLKFKNPAGATCTKTCSAVTINRNEIVPITIGGTMDFLAPAQLQWHAFYYNSSVKSITFHYNSSVTSSTNIAENGTTPIYLVDNNGEVDLYTSDPAIKAPIDCSGLFQSARNLRSIDFGDSFITSDVTNMSSMFQYCQSLTHLDLSNFNVSRVSTMVRMFQNCGSLQQLDLSSFSAQRNNSVKNMFENCRNLSSIEFNQTFTVLLSSDTDDACKQLGSNLAGGCTIHCSADFATKLQGGTNYNATKVHFNTTY